MKKIIGLVWLLFIVTPAFGLRIGLPGGGFVQQKMFHLEVADAPRLMKINYNGIPFIAKSEGTFARDILAARGLNTINISDFDNLSLSDTISFYADVPPTSIKVILFWDTDNTDLDLHVIEPDGTECYYSYKDTPLGGRLDVDVTTGYGPEIYTMEYPNPGAYQFFVHFYGGAELTEATVVAIIDEGTSVERRETFTLMLTQPGEKVFIGKVDVK